jgi:hypothetical protein
MGVKRASERVRYYLKDGYLKVNAKTPKPRGKGNKLFVEEGGLGDGGGGGFAAGYAYYAEDGDFGEG